jgi:hypothetical protein
MPFGDGTGPAGLGPMTGRRAGFCGGRGAAGRIGPGVGRGWRNWFRATGLTARQAPVDPLQSTLDDLRKRIEALEAKPE